jgi:rod shape-determining protein MreC
VSTKSRLDKSRPFLVLGIVVLAWLLLPAAVKRFARAGFYEFQAPFDALASRAGDLREFWALKTRPANELIAAGRELARLNASYEYRLQRDADLRTEIARLEELLRLPAEPGFRAEPARVIGRDFATWWSRLTIGKGRAHGLKPGSPVVFSGGLAGRVAEVHARSSTVELLTSPDIRVSVLIEGGGRPFAFQGSANNPGFGVLADGGVAEFVPPAADAGQRRIVTSGLGGVYPKNLEVGRLVRVEASADGLFLTGAVRVNPALAGLREVTVLVPDGGE